MIEPVLPRNRAVQAWTSAATPLILFMTLGLPAGALGVAWPHMRASLGAPLAGLGLLLAAVTVTYFVASASSGPLALRFGGATLITGGCALTAMGLVGLSLATRWWIVPLLSLPVGAGAGLIDASVNAHVALSRGIRYMGWLHASWAAGAALAPQVVVVSLAVTGSWRAALAAMGAAFLASGFVVAARRGDWVRTTGARSQSVTSDASQPATYRRAMVLLATLFFLGAGLEATAGDWSYTQLTLGRSVSAGAASWGATLFWAGLAGGRMALGVLGHRATPTRLLDGGIAVSALATLAFWLAPPLVSTFIALPLLGVAVSVIFPLLLSLTPSRVGAAMTGHAVGYGLAAGTIGGGGLPAAIGLVLQAAGLVTLGPQMTTVAAGLVILHGVSRRSARRGQGPPAS